IFSASSYHSYLRSFPTRRSSDLIDARTSDAIALALRFDAPIFTYKNILDKAGVYLQVNPFESKRNEDDDPLGLADEESPVNTEVNYTNHTIEELYEMLEIAVSNEDYEKAVKIRDEISRREQKK